MNKWSENLYQYYTQLKPPALPGSVEWLYPQRDSEVLKIVQQFLTKFYADTNDRTLLLGINPGRFGAGVTGVNFTAPRQLRAFCQIENSFRDQTELSAEFIYSVINEYGGAEKFYGKFFIGSVCPLGFVQNGRNLNYYDDKHLLAAVELFIIESMSELLSFTVNRNKCLCIGGEKNFSYLLKLNEHYAWFKQIIPLPHPRFIMQYKRKQMKDFVSLYLNALI